jgi:hypothetical protein
MPQRCIYASSAKLKNQLYSLLTESFGLPNPNKPNRLRDRPNGLRIVWIDRGGNKKKP